MGEQVDGSAGVAGGRGATAVIDGPPVAGPPDGLATEASGTGSPEYATGRRRFTAAAVVGTVVAAVPFVWILWGAWEPPDPVRKTAFEDNFYDLQARAIFHGHLW